MLVLLAACGGAKEKQDGDATDGSPIEVSQTPAQQQAVPAISLWDGLPIRTIPADNGKYKTSANLGEKLTYLGVEQQDTVNKRARMYVSVRLADGTEGWALKDLVIINNQVGVLLAPTTIYKRPDLMARDEEAIFAPMQVIGVLEQQEDWLKVKGKRPGGTWFTSGWIKADALSTDQKDLAVAIFARKALDEKEDSKKISELQKIMDNADFAGSRVATMVADSLTRLTTAALPVVKEIDPNEAATEIGSAVQQGAENTEEEAAEEQQ